MTKTQEQLKFGYNRGLPKGGVEAAWGARAIFGDSTRDYFIDLLWDRQDTIGDEAEAEKLHAWLNGGALHEARNSKVRYELTGSTKYGVVLYEDEVGIIKASPQASYGYLYIVAYLKEENG